MVGHGLCMMVRLHNYCRHSAVSCILRSKGNLPSPYHEQPKSCGIAVVSRRSIGVGPADGVDCRRLSSLPAANSMARVRMVVSILRSYGRLNLESFKSHILVRLFGRSLSISWITKSTCSQIESNDRGGQLQRRSCGSQRLLSP